MTNAKLKLLSASAGLLLIATSALAASPRTDAFVLNARPNVNFLDRSSRLALDKKAVSPRVRTFAHDEAEEQTITANAFVAWAETHNPRAEVVVGGGVAGVVTAPVGGVLNGAGEGVGQVLAPLGPVGAIAAAPLTVAGGVTNGVGGVVDGAVDGAAGGLLPGAGQAKTGPLIGAGLLPADRENMDHLSALDGHSFDSLYLATQQDSLRQLAVLYRDYLANGDDPALLNLSKSELPKVNRRLTEIEKLGK